MLPTFNKYSPYFNKCVAYILTIIVANPMFNNYDNICEILDIYMRKFISNNEYVSGYIHADCYDMVHFFFNQEYIDEIKSSFVLEEDAYHYLAILTQFQRMANKYNLLSRSHHHHYVPDYMLKAITELQ